MKKFFLNTFIFGISSVAILPLFNGKSTAQDRQTLESAFSARRQEVLQYFVEQDPPAGGELASVAAKCAAQEKLPEAVALYAAQLRHSKNDLAFQFSLIAAYAHGAKSFPDSLKILAPRHFSINPMPRGRGELDWHLYYSTILLAEQLWPQATDRFNGKTSEENRREASEYLMQWMQSVALQGQTEFDSPEHLPSFLMPLFVLYDFVEDAQFRHRARMILDLLLADFAAEHLAGQYTGANGYSSAENKIAAPRSNASALAWLLFGWGELAPNAELLFAALSSYEVPAVVLGMGINRSESYVHRERKPSGALYRSGLAGKNFGGGEKYTYVTGDYALGSITGELAHPFSQQSWAVNYVSTGDRHPVFFATHPYAGDERLGMFFPDPLRVVTSPASLHDTAFADPKKLHGASPYEILFQHRNALIALYDIPESAGNPWIAGFLSKDIPVREASENGWILCNTGRVFLAIKFLRPVDFEELSEGWRLLSRGRRNAVIVELGSLDDCPSFEEFKRRFAATKVSSSNISGVVTKISEKQSSANNGESDDEKIFGIAKVTYTSSYGDVYELSSLGERKLNGYPILANRSGKWPLFDGPFIKADERRKTVLLRNAKRWRQLDFAKWEIRDVDGTFGAELTKKR